MVRQVLRTFGLAQYFNVGDQDEAAVVLALLGRPNLTLGDVEKPLGLLLDTEIVLVLDALDLLHVQDLLLVRYRRQISQERVQRAGVGPVKS